MAGNRLNDDFTGTIAPFWTTKINGTKKALEVVPDRVRIVGVGMFERMLERIV